MRLLERIAAALGRTTPISSENPLIDASGRRWWNRTECAPINLVAGDSIQLEYVEKDAGGRISRRDIMTETFNDSRTITEAGIFEDTTDEGQNMICGAFIEAKKR